MNWLIYFISDGTGITAESIGQSLLTQFPDVDYISASYPYIDTSEKAKSIISDIKNNQSANSKTLIFSTLINSDIRNLIKPSADVFIDLFASHMQILENAFKQDASHSIGLTHSAGNEKSYETRINAVNYALMCDDGLAMQHYDKADVILIGVSRSGKTPTCLYLALTFGVFAANYPITEEDLTKDTLPNNLLLHRSKVFGLTIDSSRLQSIRQERLPNSRYASRAQCTEEVALFKNMLSYENIPNLDVSSLSVEEISALMMREMKLQRHHL